MKWLDAAEQILRETQTALNYKVLSEQITRRNLVESLSQTPAITLHSSVNIDIRKRKSRGLPARFTLVKGEVGLAEWDVGPFEEVLKMATRTRDRAKRDLLAALRKLDGEQFETFVELLFTEMGYEVTPVGGSGDKGIDLIAELGPGIGAQRIGIQAKCYGASRSIGPNTVRLLRDALSSQQCNAGAVVATCRIDDQAVEVVNEPGKTPVELVNHERLTELAVQYKVGIRSEPLDMYREDLQSLFEPESEA
jgi:restriction endonuclease Mrr